MKIGSEMHKASEEYLSLSQEERRQALVFNGYAVLSVMNGQSVSHGTAIGRAAIVTDHNDMGRVKQGAVVISRNASPNLATIMSKACALATEYGGMGASASWFARSHGIAAVVGVAGLTEMVSDGDLVKVNGTSGTVEILKPNYLTLIRTNKGTCER